MPGTEQDSAIRLLLRRGEIPTPRWRFQHQPLSPGRKHLSVRIRCSLCHAMGYGPLDPTWKTAAAWQLQHMMAHPFKCTCGMQFITGAILAKHAVKENHQLWWSP
jgi:hypothetical protein